MTDLNALYSYQGQEPQTLPERISLSDGRSRTDASSFTEEELNDAGFTGPYTRPSFYEKTQKLHWDYETLTYSVENLYEPEPIVEQPPEPPIPIITEEFFWSTIKNTRNMLLLQSDWAVNNCLIDSNLTQEKRSEWIEYRQKLRDMPQNISYSPNHSYSSLHDLYPKIPKNN